jgi:Uncharacterized protein conserved in bacteria (DUF2147)
MPRAPRSAPATEGYANVAFPTNRGGAPLLDRNAPPGPARRRRGDAEATAGRARRGGWAVLAAAAAIPLAGPCGTTPSADVQVHGVWMIEDEVAIAVAQCGTGSLCGRIVWLRTPRDDAGHPQRDAMNPDAAQRSRPLCGLPVLDGLLPVPGEPGRWDAGSFYDPRDGRGDGLAATRVSADVLMARVYIGMPFLGVNQTLLRIERATGEGWC